MKRAAGLAAGVCEPRALIDIIIEYADKEVRMYSIEHLSGNCSETRRGPGYNPSCPHEAGAIGRTFLKLVALDLNPSESSNEFEHNLKQIELRHVQRLAEMAAEPAPDCLPRPTEKGKKLAQELKKAGFYKHCDPKLVSSLMQIVECFGDPYAKETSRVYSADASDITAGGGARDFILSLYPFFLRIKCRFPEVKILIADDEETVLLIDGEQVPILTAADRKDRDPWEAATRNAARAVNAVLRLRAKKERLYLVGGGHDGRVVFLTEPMFKSIKAAKITKPMPEEP